MTQPALSPTGLGLGAFKLHLSVPCSSDSTSSTASSTYGLDHLLGNSKLLFIAIQPKITKAEERICFKDRSITGNQRAGTRIWELNIFNTLSLSLCLFLSLCPSVSIPVSVPIMVSVPVFVSVLVLLSVLSLSVCISHFALLYLLHSSLS